MKCDKKILLTLGGWLKMNVLLNCFAKNFLSWLKKIILIQV